MHLPIDLDQIARICHETNRAYCETIGDSSQVPWDQAPEWQKDSARNGVAHALLPGSNPEKSHESWMKQKTEEGWKYGPVKNVVTKEHPCFVPYDQLPAAQRMKDYLFLSIVGAFHHAALIEETTAAQDACA